MELDVLRPEDIKFCVHWYEFTSHDASIEDVREVVGRLLVPSSADPAGIWSRSKTGVNGYHCRENGPNGAFLAWSPERRDVHVVFPGEVCEALGLRDLVEFWQGSGLPGGVHQKCTRVDMAWDGVPGPDGRQLDVEWLGDLVKKARRGGPRRVLCEAQLYRPKPKVRSKSGGPVKALWNESGDTLYLGSTQSQRYVRFYSDRPGGRIELVVREEAAEAVHGSIVMTSPLGAVAKVERVAKQILRDYVAVVKDGDAAKERRKATPSDWMTWWRRFVEGEEVEIQEVRRHGGGDATVLRNIRNVRRQYGPTIDGLVEVLGEAGTLNAIREEGKRTESVNAMLARASGRRFDVLSGGILQEVDPSSGELIAETPVRERPYLSRTVSPGSMQESCKFTGPIMGVMLHSPWRSLRIGGLGGLSRALLPGLVVIGLVTRLEAAETVKPIADDTSVIFLDGDQGRAALAAEAVEKYTEPMSPVDIELRLSAKLDPAKRAANLVNLRKVRAESVRDWTAEEMDAITARLKAIHPAAAKRLPGLLPKKWKFIKTTGAGEAEAQGYTVDDVIVIHESTLAEMRKAKEEKLESFLLHEAFHVISRTNPKLRERAYAAIGFRLAGKVAFGEAFAARRISNPDGLADALIELTDAAGKKVLALPVIWSREPGWSEKIGRGLFKYMEFGLFAVEPTGRPDEWRIAGDPAQLPAPLPREVMGGFFAKIGRNTNYIIHPDEVLADNFARLILAADPRYADAYKGKYDVKVFDRIAEALTAK